MSFDLVPRNKKAETFRFGAFSWSWMLDAGVGLVLGTGPGHKPATFVYKDRSDGKCVHYNYGARVTAKEAKQMAQIARWIADYQDILHYHWMKEPEDVRRSMEKDVYRIYKQPVRRDFVEKIRRFADWAEQSGGFKIF